ncbi:MAG TPA: hypothetical protein VMI32_21585 [Candidatus Solibacter sp.]|nr:hypothetical protein [Candidatus Solibacter sp.]
MKKRGSLQLREGVIMRTIYFLLVGLLMTGPILRQQNPSPAGPGMEHMQHGGFMQGGMHHVIAKGVKLEQRIDGHTIIVRIGPMNLPAHTSHMKMPQPPDLIWQIPVDGWLLAYSPRLVDANGNAVPGRVLHHTAFWNENRGDFLCPNKEEHIFGAGGELTNWAEVPGYGYRIQMGDKIRIETMVHNPTDISYDKVYLEVSIPYQQAGAGENRKNFYPAWMDVKSCEDSAYDLPAGESKKTGTVEVKYAGVLLGVGGHMHDYAKQIVLEDVTQKKTVATLDAKLDEHGEILSMPTVLFLDRGGYKFSADDFLKVSASYDNTTGRLLREGAMGIVVGYFVPANDAPFASLRRKPRPHHMAGMTHDQ